MLSDDDFKEIKRVKTKENPWGCVNCESIENGFINLNWGVC